jgi:hypothetical protein
MELPASDRPRPERNEEKIRQWKQQGWPKIKKKRKTSGAPSFSSMKAD